LISTFLIATVNTRTDKVLLYVHQIAQTPMNLPSRARYTTPKHMSYGFRWD